MNITNPVLPKKSLNTSWKIRQTIQTKEGDLLAAIEECKTYIRLITFKENVFSIKWNFKTRHWICEQKRGESFRRKVRSWLQRLLNDFWIYWSQLSLGCRRRNKTKSLLYFNILWMRIKCYSPQKRWRCD